MILFKETTDNTGAKIVAQYNIEDLLIKAQESATDSDLTTAKNDIVKLQNAIDTINNTSLPQKLNVKNGSATNLNVTGLISKGEVEIYGTAPHIDFHHPNATTDLEKDYTSRIIENNKGELNILTPNGLLVNGSKVKTAEDLKTTSLTLSAVDGVLRANTTTTTNFSYTAKYVPAIPAVFVRFYAVFDKDMSTGTSQIISFSDDFPADYKPHFQTALSAHSSKQITLVARSDGIYANIQDSGLKGYAIWGAGFWFA